MPPACNSPGPGSVGLGMIRFSLLIACLGTSVFAAPVDYSRDIQPLLAEHCLECHGPDQAKGGLNLTSRDHALKPLKSGAHGIVAGKADASALIERVLSHDLEERMPPQEKKPLKPAEIEKLKGWINEGAKFDQHWAFKPLMAQPDTRSDAAQIDAFVQTRLQAHGFQPSPEADPHTLLKRAYYDLLGLPPTPEEVDQFMADCKAKSSSQQPGTSIPGEVWSAWIDKLLKSPHFGERWGRHWLDAARYADSDGYEKDRPRPDAWRYRDWVIRAINDDLPFDQFTIQQLAGDLLPNATEEQIVATAFNRQTLTNTEGGADQEQFRVEAVFDRTETLGTVWLGLTVGCARCHTHKYDQITQKEYYQLFAFFNNGDEVTRQVPESPEKWAAYQHTHGEAAARLVPLQKQLDAAKAALPVKLPQWEKAIQQRLAQARATKASAEFKPLAITSVKSTGKQTRFAPQADGSWLASGTQVKNEAYTLEIDTRGQSIVTLQIEALADSSLPKKGPGRGNGNFVLSDVRAVYAGKSLRFHSATADAQQKGFAADRAIDSDPVTGWAISPQFGKDHQLTLQLLEPLATVSGKKLTVILHHGYEKGDHALGRFRVLASSVVTEASIAPPEVVKLLNEEPQRRNPVLIKPLFDWLEQVDPEVVAAAAQYEQAKARLPKPPLMDVRVIGQRAANMRQTKVLHRGEFLSPAEPVVPAAFSVLPPLKPAAQGEPTRLDLARWLVSPQNPLTPRIVVNQVWGRLFGEGIVRTSADFGVRGSKPTHPELLDWLARQFIDQGWSRKKLLKLIMMSATYRQSSSMTQGAESKEPATLSGSPLPPAPSALLLDPRNELLWRQNRLRVEGEIVRDLHLAASGLLSRKIGGPSVFPPMPPDIADLSYANNFKWATSTGEDRYRRGLYTFFKRTAPHPDLTTFDCPDANITNVKRTVSNTPLQALTTLNAEAFSEAARALSQRVLREPRKTDTDRLTRAFRLCLGRLPSDGEITSLRKLLDDSRAYYQSHPEEATAMTGTSAVPDVPPQESAAWTATVRIVLNMDEFITRE